jgi:hypothetical protein
MWSKGEDEAINISDWEAPKHYSAWYNGDVPLLPTTSAEAAALYQVCCYLNSKSWRGKMEQVIAINGQKFSFS